MIFLFWDYSHHALVFFVLELHTWGVFEGAVSFLAHKKAKVWHISSVLTICSFVFATVLIRRHSRSTILGSGGAKTGHWLNMKKKIAKMILSCNKKIQHNMYSSYVFIHLRPYPLFNSLTSLLQSLMILHLLSCKEQKCEIIWLRKKSTLCTVNTAAIWY